MIRRDVWWMDGDLGVSHLSSCQIPCFQQAIKWGMAMICSIRRQGEAHYVILKGNTQSSCSSWREKGRQKPTGRACFKSLQDRSSVCFQRLCSEPPPLLFFSFHDSSIFSILHICPTAERCWWTAPRVQTNFQDSHKTDHLSQVFCSHPTSRTSLG